MRIHRLCELVEFDDKRSSPKVLMNRPGYRLVLLNLRRGQGIPEHATKEMVTVYAITGHITRYGLLNRSSATAFRIFARSARRCIFTPQLVFQ
jgi:hypothetical protein